MTMTDPAGGDFAGRPGAASPGPGAASPGPGAASPGPLLASPGPGAASPGPGAASPGPGAASPGPGAASPGPLLEAVDVVRDYPSGDTIIHALRGISIAADPGELVAVRGRSGSGKTTFLNILGGLDHPTSGRVIIDGHEVSAMSEDQLVDVRRRSVAFIFQSFGLVPILSAAENVEIPLRLVRTDAKKRDARVRELLELVGLGGRAKHRPHELSGGEQQRVAIARALANRPRILLADEPTGQLDSETGHVIMSLLREVVRTEGVTAVVATHDPVMLDVADRVVELRDGELFEHPLRT